MRALILLVLTALLGCAGIDDSKPGAAHDATAQGDAAVSDAAREGAAPDGDRRVTLDDGQVLRVRELGEGLGAPLMLLTGGPGFAGELLLPLAQRLAAQHRVFLPDQRGTGASRQDPFDPSTFTLDRAVDDLEQLRAALDLEQLVLVGHSWGGVLSMAYAAQHPERVEALALVGPGGIDADFWDDYNSNLMARLGDEERATLTAIRAADDSPAEQDRVAREFNALLVGASLGEAEHIAPGAREELLANLADPRRFLPAVGRAMGPSLLDYDLKPALAELKLPALVLQGEVDPIGRPAAQLIADTLPRARLELLARVGHWPFLEDMDGLVAALEPFLTASTRARVHPTEWLTLAPIDGRGRRPLRSDAVLAAHLLDPAAPPPRAGDKLVGKYAEPQIWTLREADDKGGADDAGRVGWAYTRLEPPRGGVWLAKLRGAATLFVNGAPVFGDYYAYGQGGVPVALRDGPNELYVTGVRGGFRLEIVEPEDELQRAPWADTKPDLVRGGNRVGPLGLGLLNASERWRDDLELVLLADELFEETRRRPSHALSPLETARLALPLRLRRGARFPTDGDHLARTLELRSTRNGELLGTHTINLKLRDRLDARKETFVSEIDGSVQSFGLREPNFAAKTSGSGIAPGGPDAGLLLTLHGAGVQARGQAAAYPTFHDFWVVAPTNRSPFGFDWQDWGRRDAYEVLERALMLTGVHRSRVVLSGHSMGGHGAWHLAANDPDGFAAAAPSAGWPSFDTYGSRPEGALRELWHAADGASRTRALIDNLAPQTLYVLHGSADDNVPPEQAQIMIDALAERGVDVPHHFQEGAGHWWDGEAAPGADCLTWPALMATLREARIERMPEELAFTTVHPSVDSRHHWLSVLQPLHYGAPSSVSARWDGERLVIETENVGALRLHREGVMRWARPGSVPTLPVTVNGRAMLISVTYDGKLNLAPPLRKDVSAAKGGEPRPKELPVWSSGGPRGSKTPELGGPFKQAFDRRFFFVVGTRGDDETDAALLAYARYLASEWAYRANGYAPIVRDVDISARKLPGNPILIGNAYTNDLWNPLLGEHQRSKGFRHNDDGRDSRAPVSPLRVEQGRVVLDEGVWEGDDLTALFLRPRFQAADPALDRSNFRPVGLVGAFGFSGLPAVRAAPVLAPFVSGTGFPDFLIHDGTILHEGDAGVLAAGWFDADWKVPAED